MEHPLEHVIAWLEAGEAANYQAGVLLLQAHGGGRSLVNLLLRKDSAANREKLRYELVKVGCQGRLEDVNEVMSHFAQAVAAAVPPTTAPQQGFAHQVQPLAEDQAPTEVPEAVRAEVDDLTQLMQRVYNQRCQLSNTLADLDPADGPRVVAEILSLQNQYNALAEKRRRVVAGEPVPAVAQPAAEAAPVVDRGELVKARQNLRSNLSKAKKKLAAAQTETKKSELEQKIGVLTVELADLDMQLALPQA